MPSPRLLCIDDRPEILEIRKTSLESLGYSVLTATSAPTALATLQTMPVNAVLIEYKSEGIDAEAVAFHIRRRFPSQPIILLSAYSDMPQRIFWLIDEYVLRSDPLERLAEVIHGVTHRIPKRTPACDSGSIDSRATA